MDVIKLHLGCGPHIFQGWRNWDLEPGPGGERWDARGGLGLRPGSVDYIFSEHFIEHLTREQGQSLFRECHEALKPGGVLRISTPDLEYIFRCYKTGRISDWLPTWNPKSPAAMVNEGLRLWGHQFVYDFEELREGLLIAGFNSVTKSQWHKSKHKELVNLEVRPNIGDLIVEAVK